MATKLSNTVKKLTTSYGKLKVTVGLAMQTWAYSLGSVTKDLDRSAVSEVKTQLQKSIGPDFTDRRWSSWNAAGIALHWLVDTKVITENMATSKLVGSMDCLAKIKPALDPADAYGGRSAAIQTLRDARKESKGNSEWLTSDLAEKVSEDFNASKPEQSKRSGNKNGGGKGKTKTNTKNGGGRKRSPKVSDDAVLKAWLEAGDTLRKRLANKPQFAVDKTDVIQNDLANIDQLLMNGAERIAEAEAEAATA
tara:strand:+ start:85 stop:837 length:753 start_codon:yes stop_codon:yes gene_type:complete